MAAEQDVQFLLQAQERTLKLLANLLDQRAELAGSRLPADDAAHRKGLDCLTMTIDSARAMLQSIEAALKAGQTSSTQAKDND